MSETLERFKFWLVWREGGGTPTHPHFTKAEAEREAERLAKANTGQVFFVLKATGGVVAPEPEVRQIKLTTDPIPF